MRNVDDIAVALEAVSFRRLDAGSFEADLQDVGTISQLVFLGLGHVGSLVIGQARTDQPRLRDIHIFGIAVEQHKILFGIERAAVFLETQADQITTGCTDLGEINVGLYLDGFAAAGNCSGSGRVRRGDRRCCRGCGSRRYRHRGRRGAALGRHRARGRSDRRRFGGQLIPLPAFVQQEH